MKIEFNNLKRQYDAYAEEFDQQALKVLRSGWYVLGEEVRLFEKEFAEGVGTNHCIGCASGLDALVLAFRLLRIREGDEVIVAANAYIACVMGISINGGRPVFIEPDPSYNLDPEKIEAAITEKTKAILAVHLYGRPCDMNAVMAVAEKNGLAVVEDCAQAHGATFEGKTVGSFGTIGCFSFYPTKNLGAFGDGGCVVMNDFALAERCRALRNYGSEKKYVFGEVGMNSRLDEMQAALLRVKYRHLEEINAARKTIAERYRNGIHHPEILLPEAEPGHVWHLFVVRTKNRDDLRNYLSENGIGTDIHYPIPPHLSGAYQSLGYREGSFPVAESFAREALSLPIFQGMIIEETDEVIKVINQWREKK